MSLFAQKDTVKFDRDILGRPFDLEEIFGKPLEPEAVEKPTTSKGVPVWVKTETIKGDSVYFGIGKSPKSQAEADDQARLHFAQHVAVKVQSIATQQITENKDRLEDNYSYESLVATDMRLRAVVITEQYISSDSVFYSLIRYNKAKYHALVTQEIQIALEANIRKQELTHQAAEALRADSLRHKLMMDSLALSRKQAVIDSLDAILKMEEARIRQEQERIDLIKDRYSAFLALKPRHLLIDVPTATTPDSWIHISGRWDPQTSDIRQLNMGVSLWLLSVEGNLWARESLADQGELSIKLEVLPQRGEIYPVQLSIGYLTYVSVDDENAWVDLSQPDQFGSLRAGTQDAWQNSPHKHDSFMVLGSVGIPQYNNHLNIYLDKRKMSLGSIWYPFPKSMGDAISLINQIDFIRDNRYRNPYDDQLQWQFGLRLIAIPDRFATMLSYEDHEVWMLNFEFQY